MWVKLALRYLVLGVVNVFKASDYEWDAFGVVSDPQWPKFLLIFVLFFLSSFVSVEASPALFTIQVRGRSLTAIWLVSFMSSLILPRNLFWGYYLIMLLLPSSQRASTLLNRLALLLQAAVPAFNAVGIFGFSGGDPIGKVSFPPVQAAPSFPSSFPHLFSGNDSLRCLIPCAIDQVDIPVKYLGFFLEDDAKLEHVRTEYGAGRMLTGEVKKRLTDVLTELVERHHRARAAVTDEMVDAFMAVRPLPNMFS